MVLCIYNDLIAPGDPPLEVILEVSVSTAALPSVTNVATISTDGDNDESNDSDDEPAPVALTPAPAPASSWLGLVFALLALSWIAFLRMRRLGVRRNV
jgi:hypothetical protein